MELPDFDPLDEKYRWCVYCKADCWPDPAYHADDCPVTTGRYPVEEGRGLGPSACCRCDKEFPEGSFYRLILAPGEINDPEDDHEFKTYLTVCEDCAMAVELLGASAEE